jgi:hypothetical protein
MAVNGLGGKKDHCSFHSGDPQVLNRGLRRDRTPAITRESAKKTRDELDALPFPSAPVLVGR